MPFVEVTGTTGVGTVVIGFAAGAAADAVGNASPAAGPVSVRVVNPSATQNLAAAFAVSPGANGDGTVAYYTDPAGAPAFSLTPDAAVFGVGVRVAAADVTGDGIPDLVVGSAPGVPAVVAVIDGATRAVVRTTPSFEGFMGGVFVAAADFDQDGKGDVVVSAGWGGGPRVTILSGASGSVMANFFGIADPDFRGGARVAIGDLNADGVADLVVAAGEGGGPRVAGYDGAGLATGAVSSLFRDFFVFDPGLRNGVYLAVGDLNGDGYGELIAGAGPGGAPRVFGVSGKDLVQSGRITQLANFFSGDVTTRDGVRLAVHDTDRDGKPDVLTSAGPNNGPGVTIYPSRNISSEGTPTSKEEIALPLTTAGVFVG